MTGSADGGWSEPHLVDKTAPPPLVLGEMAEVRRAWRAERWGRWARRVWPACVAVLLAVVGACLWLILVGPVLRF